MEFLDRLRRLQFDRQQILIIVATLLVLLGAAIFFHNLSARRQVSNVVVYFVDDQTLEPIALPDFNIPPIARGGHTYVSGFFFSCDLCQSKKLGYLQKYDDATKAKMDQPPSGPPTMDAGPSGLLVRAPTAGSKWVPIESDEGQQIIKFPPCDGGGVAHPCYPEH